MALALALRELHRSETSLAHRLRRVGERHKADHDVCYLCGDLAGWSEHHVGEIARAAERYDARLRGSAPRFSAVLSALRKKGSELVGRRPEPGLLLLADLRSIHQHAAAVSLDWELLAEGAQAARDTELLALAAQCHPDTLRQMNWANTMLKELSPQVLLS